MDNRREPGRRNELRLLANGRWNAEPAGEGAPHSRLACSNEPDEENPGILPPTCRLDFDSANATCTRAGEQRLPAAISCSQSAPQQATPQSHRSTR